jgi:LemA protein
MNRRLAAFVLAPVAAASLSGCGVNSIPTAEENAKAKWADVQAAYQRRASLIPNLVATVKGAAASEQNILIGVTEARANATKIQVTGDQLTDPAALQRFAQAQNGLTLSAAPEPGQFQDPDGPARGHREPDQHHDPRL